ncbi:pirin family protein [Demequina lignilytica]|uniref:Pirin family protein n=1 Tax=Demequina lignilytica TaxID=3051663 RepID=A0AAW7M6Z5_9MICO|nr:MULTISPECIES: pirin family protein [unclassified Demequina]MDN4478395.1 pirin family protein [Demequina sp. SYSU T00039-1]MDN4482445.1 pirin family protein [Demequina sp. SYSU T0a273]MDN4487098.1 pirin family protein [Demequina sp. SYSU T00039]MDN4489809.1 pirin family protein [Demequina sp. SYSU T00068]
MTRVLAPREVPLGGLRAMSVQRSLPQRGMPSIGAWCFVDRFGPEDSLMRVDPHPHIGLQTVTWPLLGEIRHRDGLGSDVVLRPGQLNLMTSGAGIAHSEYATGAVPSPADGVQLWVALPDHARHRAPAFETHTELPRVALPSTAGGAVATVMLGELAGALSPATVHTPIVGAQIDLAAGTSTELPLNPSWEHGILLLSGDVSLSADGSPLPGPPTSGILFLGEGISAVTAASEAGATMMLIGGEPFGEDLVMWWNFVGRSHEEIVAAHHDWTARTGRFAEVPGHTSRIPAPGLPTARLTARRRAI